MPLLIIDCHAVCHSVRHAYGGLTWEDRNTGVIFGFLDRLLSLSSKFETSRVAFAWDSGKSIRESILPSYKEKRHDKSEQTVEEKEIDSCAFAQFTELRMKVLPKLGFRNVFIRTGYEADDIIASISRTWPQEVIIASDDQDLYQLLTPSVSMWKLKKKKLYRNSDFVKEYDIQPYQWVMVKTLAGCRGDNVPGIPGVGEKRAIKYIKGELKGKFYQTIRFADPKLMEMNKNLVRLPLLGVGDFPLTFPPINLDTVFEVCEDYGMYSLIKGRRLEQWKMFSSE